MSVLGYTIVYTIVEVFARMATSEYSKVGIDTRELWGLPKRGPITSERLTTLLRSWGQEVSTNESRVSKLNKAYELSLEVLEKRLDRTPYGTTEKINELVRAELRSKGVPKYHTKSTIQRYKHLVLDYVER